MPKVRGLTPEKRFQDKMNDISFMCDCLMLKNDISYQQVADLVGVTRQAISHQFRSNSITLATFIAVMNLSNASGESMERLVSIK